MRVQRVLLSGTRVESWTVLGDDGAPVESIERWLAYLSDVDRSPNTVKAYAYDAKDFFVFLALRGLDWREVRLEDIGEYVAWLALPPELRGGQFASVAPLQPHVGMATVSRKLSALAAFYDHHRRGGVDVGELLTTWQTGGRRVWKSFLHHASRGKPQARRTIKLRVPKKLPRVVTAGEMQAILDACERLRDRLLFALLWDSESVSVRRWGCGTRTSPRRSGSWRSCRGSTTTGRGPSPAAGSCRSARRSCACTGITFTASTAIWTRTMCS